MPTPPILTVPYRNDSCSHRSFQVRMSAIVIASLAFPIVAGLESGDTLAQTRQVTPTQAAPQKQFFPVRQMPLTKELIQGFVAATEEVNKTTDNAEEDIDKLRPETVAKLDGVARKCGLASYDQYKQISENIGLIESGFDDVTKRYVGREALIRIRASRVKADKKMTPESKTERLTDLNDQLRVALPEVQYKANIALIAKYYDQLTAIAR